MNKPTINEKIQKLFNIEVKSVDEKNRSVKFCFSDNSVDRYGEIVDQKTWDTKSYEKNPVILWGHNPEHAQNVIGSGGGLELDINGKSYITATFDDDDHSSLIFNKLKKGILRCVSAGFIPHTLEFEDDVPVLKDNELLEVSVVAIPANRNAVALDYKAGEIKQKDAQFLIKSMREEADSIEAAMAAKDATADTKTVEELQAELDAALVKVTEAETRAEEAEVKTADAKKLEDEDGKKTEDDPANDGENDQSGAGDPINLDDIDLEADLTPEQEKQIAEALAPAA